MPKKDSNYDMDSPLKDREAGRIITLLRGRGIIIRYRELTGFSPTDAAALSKLRKYGVTAKWLAESAGRPEIVQVSEVT